MSIGLGTRVRRRLDSSDDVQKASLRPGMMGGNRKEESELGEGGSFGERAVNEMHHFATASKFIMGGDSFSHHHLMEETR